MRFHFATVILFCLLSALAYAGGPSGNSSPISIRVEAVDCLDGGVAKVQFSTETSLSDVQSWQWNFGNGATSNAEAPLYSYPSTGSYSVSLAAESVSSPYLHEVTESDLIQINDLILIDDFGSLVDTQAKWEPFSGSTLLNGSLISNGAALFELQTTASQSPRCGQTDGEIICLGPGGNLFDLSGESSGQFHLELEFSDADPRDVSFTVLHLLDTSSFPQFQLARLEVQKISGRFDVRIKGNGTASEWIRLSTGPSGARILVELDWYSPHGPGGVHLNARILDLEGTGAPTRHDLQIVEQFAFAHNFDTVLLGVIDLEGNIDESRGQMRVNSFRACRFDHRPR